MLSSQAVLVSIAGAPWGSMATWGWSGQVARWVGGWVSGWVSRWVVEWAGGWWVSRQVGEEVGALVGKWMGDDEKYWFYHDN